MEEEKKYKEIELRSEEVQEVMNHISPWVVRWGITVLFIILLALLAGCWIFKYPDVLQAEVTLTTEEPPAFILARSMGKIDTLYVHNGDMVKAGEHLGVIQNASVTEDVLWLTDRMKDWGIAGYEPAKGAEYFIGKSLQLGELQSAYASFMIALSDYVRFIEQDYYAKKMDAGKKQLAGQRSYLNLVEREHTLTEKEMELAQSMYDRDSILYARNAMIVAEFEESGSRYLQSLRTRETSGMSLLQAEMQLKQQEENLLDLGKQAYDEEQNRRLELKNAIEQLQAQLSSWAQNYLFSSPIYGKITFMTVWSRNQNVQSGETVFVVQSSEDSNVVGKAKLPLQGSGKVQVGQKVHIRMDNYPDQEFGYVRGKVESISPAPTEDVLYVVERVLQECLHTNYGKTRPTLRELKGTADIILADRNVLERLLAPLRKIVEYED